MLDTDTCVYLINREPRLSPGAAPASCAISQIVLGELEYGVANSAETRREHNRRLLFDFLSAVRVLQLSDSVARAYGETRAYLRRAGTQIGVNDCWIAAHALVQDMPLITNNTREFRRIPHLKIDTWMT